MRRTESVSLKDAIGEFLERNKLKKKFDQTEVINLWKTMFGPVVANRTTQLFFRDGKLYVSLSSSVLRQELAMNKAKIIKSLNDEMNMEVVKDVIFK